MLKQTKHNNKKIINIHKTPAAELKQYRKILNRSLEILPNQTDIILFERTLHTISIINQKQICELADEVYKIMETVVDLREHAIETLGFWLKIPWFKEQAYEIFTNNPDVKVKFSALLSWVSYYINSKCPLVLEKLYKILINETQAVTIRKLALSGILNVSGSKANLINTTNSKKLKFNEQINWKAIIKILKKYAPDALKIS